MSDTPRTDSELLLSDCTWGCGHSFSYIRDLIYNESGKCVGSGEEFLHGNEGVVVPADFARDLERENARLRIALADAIRRPMGAIPTSADGLVSAEDLRQAEQRCTSEICSHE
jgi:hypothetical protein